MRDGLWGLSEGATDLVMALIAIVALALALAWVTWSVAGGL